MSPEPVVCGCCGRPLPAGHRARRAGERAAAQRAASTPAEDATPQEREQMEFRALLGANDLRPVFTIRPTGEMRLGEGVSPDEAAREFVRLVTERMRSAMPAQHGTATTVPEDVRAFLQHMSTGDAWVNTEEREQATRLLETHHGA